MSFLNAFLDPWTWRMAWRDSRRSRGRLLLFSTALTLGVAALVAIGTLGANLNRAIDEQARSLVGADLVLEGRTAPTPEQLTWEATLGGEQSREVGLSSMAVFPKTGGTRLVQVRAWAGRFPFYGQVETDPPEAAERFARGEGALVEESLLLQFNAQPGVDTFTLGGKSFPILGALRKLPGEAAAFSGIAPRVLIARDQLPAALTCPPRLCNPPPAPRPSRREFPQRFPRPLDVAHGLARQPSLPGAAAPVFHGADPRRRRAGRHRDAGGEPQPRH